MNRKELLEDLDEAVWWLKDSDKELEEISEDRIQASKSLEYNFRAEESIARIITAVKVVPRRRHH